MMVFLENELADSSGLAGSRIIVKYRP